MIKSLNKFFAILFLALAIPAFAQNSDIYINEFMAKNLSVNMDSDFYGFGDWIELYNSGDQSINLEGYTLSYSYLEDFSWRIPSNTVIGPHEYLIIWADEHNTRMNQLHANFTLQREGGIISLNNSSGVLIDSVHYGRQKTDASYGRNSQNYTESLYFADPSPGEKNTSPAFNSPDRTPEPEFSIQGGVFSQPISISITCDKNPSLIYYTLDGSKPTSDSPIFDTPLNINSTTVVRAIAKSNALPSRTVTHSYLINENITLPIISVSMDHKYFWDDEIGFYVEGTNGLTGWEAGYGPSPKSNFNQNWRRPMNFEFFDEAHELGFSTEGDIKVYGGWSRGAVIKSFAVYPESSINYRLFKEKSFTNYESFIIRNSGNDWPSTKIRDAALQSLAINQLDLDLQANRPAVLFVNGEFWGVLNIREKINEDYAYTNHGVHQDSIDFLEKYTVVKSGDKKHYLAMMEYLNTHSLADQGNYEYFKTLVDVEECMNYFITGIYSGHGDWIYNGNNNLRLWRPRREDGKWRWLLYDTDGAFYSSSGRGIAEAMSRSTILTNILENEEARAYFTSTFTALLNNAFAPERAVHMIDSLKARIEPDVTRHIEKWKNTKPDGSTADWKTPGAEGYLQIGDGYMGPCLTSFDQWESKFGTARNVAAQRPSWLLNEIRSLFTLGDSREVRFRLAEKNSGIVLVNNIEVLDYLGSDTYLEGQILDFEALPQYGYKFKHWEVGSYSTITTNLIPKASLWRYLDDGSDQGSAWSLPTFDDTGWSSGYGELGYGDGGESTELGFGGNATNKYVTSYFRKEFTVDDPDLFDELTLNVMRDDGVIIYLNGTEIVRDNMPAGATNNQSFALAAVSSTDESYYFSYSVPVEYLVQGENTLAVEIHQISLTSSDISFDLELKGVQSNPVNNEVITENKFEKTLLGNTLVKAVFETTNISKSLYINEVMASNVNYSWPSEMADSRDWIEIYNSGNKTVNIAGMYISDDISNSGLFRIPETDLNKTSVPPGGFIILYADGKPELGPDHLIFKLDKESEEIVLSDEYARKIHIIDSIAFSSQIMDVSFGRLPDGAAGSVFMEAPSPSSPNRPNTSQKVSGLFINEIMPDNLGIVTDNYDEYDDWIEIYNSNEYPVATAGLFLTDDFSNPTKWRIPQQYLDKTTIPAEGHILFWADEDTEQGVNHLNFKLSSLSEELGLYQLLDQEIVVIDSMSYSLSSSNISFGRYPDSEAEMFTFVNSTPGQPNYIEVSTEINKTNPGFKVYPNPSAGIIYVDADFSGVSKGSESTLQIIGIKGELLKSITISSSQSVHGPVELDISELSPGMYFIKFIQEKTAFTQKFVIRRS